MCYSGLMGLNSCYGAGHVPHTGRGKVQLVAPSSNPTGLVVKKDTHHIDKSLLNEVAL